MAGMMYGPPQPPPRRSHTTRNILIIVGAVLLLCCGGAVAGGFALFRTVQNTMGPARDKADDFLTQVESDQVDAAYQSLCQQTRDQFSLDRFGQLVGAQPKLTRHSITGTNVANNNGAVSATVNTRLYYADGSSAAHPVDLIKVSGAWWVCGQPY